MKIKKERSAEEQPQSRGITFKYDAASFVLGRTVFPKQQYVANYDKNIASYNQTLISGCSGDFDAPEFLSLGPVATEKKGQAEVSLSPQQTLAVIAHADRGPTTVVFFQSKSPKSNTLDSIHSQLRLINYFL